MAEQDTHPKVMNERVINELEASGDIETLAEALRNIIAITDHATSGAQAAANARQEYVPTTLYKDDLYRAMDAALRGEPYEPFGSSLAVFDDEFEEELEAPDPPVGTDYRPLARALRFADDQWEMFQNSISAEQDPDANYFVWVAQAAQSYLDSDQAARNKPVELRGGAS